MEKTNLKKETLLMELRISRRVKFIKKKRIFEELKRFKIINSVRMFSDWFFTEKIK
jgi:hypothetical protein